MREDAVSGQPKAEKIMAKDMGRKLKYNAELIAEVEKQLAIGMSRTDTWQIVGISESTFYEWMDRPEFSEAVRRGEFACKQRMIVRIQNASKKSWYAASWWLSRKFPEEFAEKTKFEGTLKADLAVRVRQTVDLSRLTDAELKALAKKMLKADAAE
jgi:hypothetical protein